MFNSNRWKNFKAFLLGLGIALLLCEIILRIYNPFPFALQKGKLVIPANIARVYENQWIPRLDKKIVYSRNSLGFRGPELPVPDSGWTKIITVGGSTTACTFLSDSCTWPFLLEKKLRADHPHTWLNNAGIDGHSSFGHILMLRDHVLSIKPDYVLFLMGINDTETNESVVFDEMTEKKIHTRSTKSFIKSLLNYSELGRTLFSFYQVSIAYKKGLYHQDIDVKKLVENPLPDSIFTARLNRQNQFLKSYRERTDSIITLCRKAGVKPIFLTQPSLFGSYTDSITGVNMTNKWMNNKDAENSLLQEKILELYNDVLRNDSLRITVIDLARKMPKDSRYYYDFIHFTNEGAEKVSEILSAELQQIMLEK
jgi:hypothetical protein